MPNSYPPWYKPEIGPRLKPVIREVYETWSGLSGDELVAHLHRIRDKAWPYGEYPCIGQWLFLLPSISVFPVYPSVLALACAGATVLDLGCCFGQNLRLLTAHGAPTANMYGLDVNPPLWELGYDLFGHREKMAATFVRANILERGPTAGGGEGLRGLEGRVDVVIACQFLHLFDWEGQVEVAKRVVGFSRPRSLLVGYQRAQMEAGEMTGACGRMYFHNVETFREMWGRVENETGTRWHIHVDLVDLSEWVMEEEDVEWMPPGKKVNGAMEEVDLYEVLGLSRGASKAEIKKAYHKAALSHHPDKVHADDRDEADIKFKSISQAYEILYDDEKREMYDTYGMDAFDPSRGGMPGGASSAEDLLAQLFGMGAGMPPGFGGGGPRRPRRGDDEHQEYKVTLEELYKGKSARFSSTKKVVCSHCNGSGGKEGTKAKPCGICHGRGSRDVLRAIGPGRIMQEVVECGSCDGTGKIFKDKDKCKKCKGRMTVSEKKLLEIYIPRGSKHGDRIVLAGEADQLPGQQPGDIVFTLVQSEHPVFKREGADLAARIEVTLAEALCGFSRAAIKHLDGRGLLINHQKPEGGILRPGQVIKVAGEGMPYKKSDLKGDLYLTVDVKFPDDEWLRDEKVASQLRKILPPPNKPIRAETVDEVEHDTSAKMEDFGTSDGGQAWVDDDEDDEAGGRPQCAQQ